MSLGIPSSRSFLARQLRDRLRVPHAAVWPRKQHSYQAQNGQQPVNPQAVSVGAAFHPYGAGTAPVSVSSSVDWLSVRSTAQSCIGILTTSFPEISPVFPTPTPGSSEYYQHLLQKITWYAYNVLAHLESGLSPGQAPHILPAVPRSVGPCSDKLLPSTWVYHTTVEGWNVLYSVFQIASCLATVADPTGGSLNRTASTLSHCLYPVFAFAPSRSV